MDHTFINKTIVAFNGLISSVTENSVVTTGIGDKGDVVILLGAVSQNQLAATVFLGSYPLLTLSGDNPRDIAERLSNTLDQLDNITEQAIKDNSQFGEYFEHAIEVAFYRTLKNQFS